MSITSTITAIDGELSRIQNAKAGIIASISAKGVTVPSGTALDNLPGYIQQIQTGSAEGNGIPTITYSVTGDISGSMGGSLQVTDMQTGASYGVNLNPGTYQVIPGDYHIYPYPPMGYTPAWDVIPPGAYVSGDTLEGNISANEALTCSMHYTPRTDCQLAVYCALQNGMGGITGAEWSVDDGATWTASGSKLGGLTYAQTYTIIGRRVPGYASPAPTPYTLTGSTDTSTTIYYAVEYASAYYVAGHPTAAYNGSYADNGQPKTINGTAYKVYVKGDMALAPCNQYGSVTYALVTTADAYVDSYYLPTNYGTSQGGLQPMTTWSYYDGNTGGEAYFNAGTVATNGDTIIVTGDATYAGTYTVTDASASIQTRRWVNSAKNQTLLHNGSNGGLWLIVPSDVAASGWFDPMMGYPYCQTPYFEPPYYLDGTSRSWVQFNSQNHQTSPVNITLIPQV